MTVTTSLPSGMVAPPQMPITVPADARAKASDLLFVVIEAGVETETSAIMMEPVDVDAPYGNDVATVMIEAIASYTTTTGNAPSDDAVMGMIAMLNPPTKEVALEVVEMLNTLIEDPTGLVSTFDAM